MKKLLFNTAHPLSESGKPIFIPFGEWNYDGKSRQRLDRAHGEAIANELNARVARGEPGIPVYQGHPDVPELASKYPDKGALGWVTHIELVNESPDGRAVPGLALTVEWDRDPGKGFKWFSPYWMANSREGATHIVSHISSIGLVNNPNISEFRLANEAEDNNNNNNERKVMDRDKLIQMLGLPPETTDDQITEAIAALKAKADDRAAAEEKAKADIEAAKAREAEKAEALDNEKKAHEATKTALANEKAARADMALDAAVKERRIGETARETWKTRLVNEGAPAYTALANEKPLSTTDRAKGLVNECGGEDKTKSTQRVALVNEIMSKENLPYFQAWTAAKERKPDLFND